MCDNCEWTILDFGAMCGNVEELLKFLEQHDVVLRTWWWRKHHRLNCKKSVPFRFLVILNLIINRTYIPGTQISFLCTVLHGPVNRVFQRMRLVSVVCNM